MCLRNTETRYGTISKCLHWIVLILILCMLGFGAIMGYFPKPIEHLLVSIHKLVGLVVLFFAMLFCVWSLFSIKPAYTDMALWEKKLASAVRMLMYFCMLLMPLSGWIMATAAGKYPRLFFWEFAMPLVPASKPLAMFANTTHWLLAWLFLGLIVLHVAGALKHHLIDRNDLLTRMMGIDRSN